MTDKDTHTIRNGVIATVLGGFILYAIPYTRDILPGIARYVAHGVSIGAQAVWHHLTSTINLPWYTLWPLILFSLPAIWRLVRLCAPRNNKEPLKSDYTEDMIVGVRWKWEFGRGYNPTSISPFCPMCQTRLVYSEEYYPHKTTFQCETCRQNITTIDGDYHFAVGTIARQIERILNTGEWKTRIRRAAESGS